MKTLRIKDICDKGSSNLKQKDVENQNGKYPVFGASGLIGNIDTYHQNKDYIAIVKDGSGIGRVSFMPAFSSVIGTLQYILPKEGFNIKYISYCLQSLDLAHYKQGAAIPHIYYRDYGEYEVNVEENPDDQQRIVSYLDSGFEKIEAIKTNAANQLQAAKDMFQAALKELLTPKKGWSMKQFGEVCDYHKVQDKWKDIPYIGLEHIEAHTGNLLGSINSNEVESSTFKFQQGDVLYGRLRPYLQKVIIAPFDGCCSTEIFPIKSEIINHNYLKYWLLSDEVTTIMNESCSGCRMPRANMTDFRKQIISFPNQSEQFQIVNSLNRITQNIHSLEENYDQTITLCNDLKQALLKKIFE